MTLTDGAISYTFHLGSAPLCSVTFFKVYINYKPCTTYNLVQNKLSSKFINFLDFFLSPTFLLNGDTFINFWIFFVITFWNPCATSILGAEGGIHLFKGPGLFVLSNVSGAINIPHPTSIFDFRVVIIRAEEEELDI